MLRKTNLFLLKNGKILANNNSRFYRNFGNEKSFKEKLSEKIFLTKVIDKYTLTKLPEKQIVVDDSVNMKGDHWQRLFEILQEILNIYKQQLLIKMKDLHVDVKILEMKKIQAEKLSSILNQENMKKFVAVSQEQLKMIKESKAYQNLPTSKELTVKVKDFWIIFNESQYKDKFIQIVKTCIASGKKGAIEVINFVKLVYNAPSNGKPK